MKLPNRLFVVTLLALAGHAGAVDVEAAASAPSRGASNPAAAGSPAVRAAESARVPGEVRPEKRPVPQIIIPLKRTGQVVGAASPSRATDADGIDDAAARCLALKTQRERAACKRPASQVSRDAGER